MRKILIICEWFAPRNAIAAMRPTKLAKYLKKNFKDEVWVLTTKFCDVEDDKSREKDLEYVDKIIAIQNTGTSILLGLKKRYLHKENKANENKKIIKNIGDDADKRKKDNKYKLRELLAYEYRMFNEKCDYASGRANVESLPNDFDVVFSTYPPLWAHKLAEIYKKKNPQCIWIADFRDPILNNRIPGYAQKKAIQLERDIQIKADIITGVSEGALATEKIASKWHILPNGFDEEDLQEISQTKNIFDDNKFHFAYTGRVYPQDDLSPVFKALRELCDAGSVDRNKVIVNYAGVTDGLMRKQAKAYGMENIIVSHGLVTHREALKIQQSSQCVLLASWNTRQSEEIISGKFYEYAFSGKPIVCLMSGDVPESKLKQLIAEVNLGLCYENARKETDYIELKEYILRQYKRYEEFKTVDYAPIKEKLTRFSYRNLADELNQLINSY